MKLMSYLLSGLAVVAVLCLVLAGCKKDNGGETIVEMKVDAAEASFSQKGDSRDFNIVYTEGWRVEAEGLEGYYGPNKAAVRDFTVEPASGTGNAKVTVILDSAPAEGYEIELKIVGKGCQAVVKLKAIVEQAGL